MMFRLSGILIMLFGILFYGCEVQNPDEVFKNAMDEKEVSKRIARVEAFTAAYPEHENISRAYSRLFRDYLQLGQTENALSAAGKYLNAFPEDARVLNYNFVAWTLAENEVALDSAKVYAERAIILAGKNQIRQLSMIQDTYAYILYLLNDYQAAEAIQTEAMPGNEQSGEYLLHLALYQYANGKKELGMQTMARAILYGAEDQAKSKLRAWLTAIEPENARQTAAGKITQKAVGEFLGVRDNSMRRTGVPCFMRSLV